MSERIEIQSAAPPPISPSTLRMCRQSGLEVVSMSGGQWWTAPDAGEWLHRVQDDAGFWDQLAKASPGRVIELPHDLQAMTLLNVDRRTSAFSIAVLAGRANGPSDSKLASNSEDAPQPASADASNNRGMPTLDATTFSSLATMAMTLIRTEFKLLDSQRELDSLSSQLADSYEELTLIYQLSSGMKVNRSAEEFFMQACIEVMQVMHVRGVGFLLFDKLGRLESDAIYGDVVLDLKTAHRLRNDLAQRFTPTSKPLMINDLSADPGLGYLSPFAKSLLAVPLQRQDSLLGCLFCFDKLGDEFGTTDSKLLNSIGSETSIYLENAHLFADARGLMMGMLHALTSAVDAKDAYTCGHSQRVALFAKEIASRAGIAEPLCERVYMAGLLHDVGKIGVPESVLQKPGKLTPEEFDEMKKHVDIGARILRDIKQVEDLVPGVLHHHERYDGKGYPHRLSGHEIPLMARVLCVADCFDAMTSSRTYRSALPVEVAMMEIRRCSGTQFDPLLADALLSIGSVRLRELIASVTDTVGLQLRAA